MQALASSVCELLFFRVYIERAYSRYSLPERVSIRWPRVIRPPLYPQATMAGFLTLLINTQTHTIYMLSKQALPRIVMI